MTLLGSQQTGLGSVPTADGAGGDGSGGGTVEEIISTDGTVVIGNPTGPIVDLSVPGSTTPVVIGKFTGGVWTSESPTFGYLADAGQNTTDSVTIPEPAPQLYPTGARTFSAMRVTATGGGSATLSNYTVTLYKNGAATAQQVTVPGGTAPGTVIADVAHPIAFAANDTFDVRWDIAAGDGSKLALAVTLEGPAGSGGGGGAAPGSAVTGLTFPIVAGTPTLTATDPVVLPGLIAGGGGLEVVTGAVVVDAGVPTTLHDTLEVDGVATMNGTVDANNGLSVQGGANVQGGLEVVTGAVVADAGVPTTLHDTLEVDGPATMNGSLVANNGLNVQGGANVQGGLEVVTGAVVVDAGVPTTLHSTLEVDGAATLNGGGTLEGAPLSTTQIWSVDTVNTSGAELSALPAANMPIGSSLAWVASVGAYFRLASSALTVDHLTVETASGLAGGQWLRMSWLNPKWQAQTGWFVNTSTGNDEAAGAVGTPLKTMSEAARRLAFAQLSATTVTLIGSMASTDLPTWSFSGGFFCMSIVGTPATLFTGAVTTAVNNSAAPTTSENDLTDTSIPTSWTASGLLANGVLVSFTSGAAGRSCWVAKDLGTKTARISKPHSAFSGDAAFANGDTYVAQQLPTVRQMRFVGLVAANAVFCQNLLFPAGYSLDEQCVYAQNCWFTTAAVASNVFENCAFQGAGSINGMCSNTNACFVLNGGMWRGSGTTQFLIFAAPGGQTNDTLTIEGVWWNLQNGSFVTIQGDLLCYDCTASTGPISANYWSEILFSVGSVGGSNNTLLASVSRMGQIAHIPTPLWLAGSATSANPILVAGTVGSPLSVAQETAGLGVVNARQNGIYQTA